MSKMKESTTSYAITAKHWKDVQKEALSYRLAYMRIKAMHDYHKIRVGEAMAGCGFGTTALLSVWPDARLHLNDINHECTSILRFKYPNAKVYQEDGTFWEAEQSFHISTIDFNNFTLKKWDQWEPLMRNIVEQTLDYMIITDSACFGFAMGNLKVYGATSPEHYYYELLRERTVTTFGMTPIGVVDFGHAALVVLGRCGKFQFLFDEPVVIRQRGIPSDLIHGFHLERPKLRMEEPS